MYIFKTQIISNIQNIIFKSDPKQLTNIPNWLRFKSNSKSTILIFVIIHLDPPNNLIKKTNLPNKTTGKEKCPQSHRDTDKATNQINNKNTSREARDNGKTQAPQGVSIRKRTARRPGILTSITLKWQHTGE